jgi:hypothetical protein
MESKSTRASRAPKGSRRLRRLAVGVLASAALVVPAVSSFTVVTTQAAGHHHLPLPFRGDSFRLG